MFESWVAPLKYLNSVATNCTFLAAEYFLQPLYNVEREIVPVQNVQFTKLKLIIIILHVANTL